jgi:hypothetical protein
VPFSSESGKWPIRAEVSNTVRSMPTSPLLRFNIRSTGTVHRKSALLLGMVTLGIASSAYGNAPGSPNQAFEGTVGKAKVIMLLDTASGPGNLTGTYFYRTNGIDISVSGSASKLTEVDPNTISNYEKAVTGTFSGVLSTDTSTYKGTWKAAKGSKSLPFALKSIGSPSPGTAPSVTITTLVKTAKSKSGPATYRFPTVVGTKPDWIATRINADAKSRSLGDDSLSRVVADFESNGSGVTGVDYRVNHNANGLLSLTMTSETMGAYPDAFREFLVYDLRSGARVRPAEVFSNFDAIRSLIQKQVKDAIAAAKAEDPSSVDDLNLMLGETQGSVDDEVLGRFIITKTGLTFQYLFGFPHVAKALEPNGDVALRWAELKPFLRSDGLLAPLAK